MTTIARTPRQTRRPPRSLAVLIDTVLRHVESDLGEEEAVHDLRVACRRLEAGARLNRDVLPGKRWQAVRDAAKEIRRAFDQARDLEVIAAELAAVSGLSDAFREGVRAAARHQEASAGARGRIGDAVARLAKARARLTESDLPERESLAAALRATITAFFDESARLVPESTDDALHELRIDTKKLRYAMEISRPAFPRLTVQIKRLKGLQEILGRHQDAAVGLRWAEALAAGELGATADDRAILMRYYAALAREQRRRLRRLLDRWRTSDMRGRFLAAVS